MPRRIESLFLNGPAGRLESLLEPPEENAPREIAVVCHPHPLHGGTLHNKVVFRLARAFRRRSAAVLRFNFRGVNRSQGTHDFGRGEVDDALAAAEYLRSRYPGLPLSLAGFSFGARVAMAAACRLVQVRRVVAAGYPAAWEEARNIDPCRTERIFVQSTHDIFGPPGALESFFQLLPEPKRLYWVEAQDHFFTGALDQFEQTVLAALSAEGWDQDVEAVR